VSRIEVSVHVGASPEVVWDFVSDLRHIPEWIQDTLAMLTVEPEPAQQGTVYRERSRIIGPLSQVTTWEISEFDAPRFQKHDGQVPMMAATSVSFGLEPSAGATKFTLVFEYTPGNPVSSLGDRLFLNKSLRSSFGRSLQKLKALVEAEQAPSSAGQ
jgi:carbon monoxide dehydrogenase subunit G